MGLVDRARRATRPRASDSQATSGSVDGSIAARTAFSGLFDAEEAIGTHGRGSWSAGGAVTGGGHRPRRRIVGDRRDEAATRMITTPTTIAVSCQNWNGKSWTSRSVAGSKSYEPAGKNSRWKSSKSGVERDERDDADRRRRPTISPSAPCRTARHVAAAGPSGARPAIDGRRPPRPRPRSKPDEHAADVAHVAALPLVEDRRAGDRDVEVGRPDDEVGEDRVGRGAQLGVGVAGPRRRPAARPCSKPTQAGVRNGEDRDRDDDDRRGDARSDGRGAAAEACAPRHRSPSAWPPRAYSSSRVLACSHQPSIVRSVGGSTSELGRGRGGPAP